MISFRLSPEEYRTLHEACLARGMSSISDLARAALRKMKIDDAKPAAISDEVRDLKDRIEVMSLELERVSQLVKDGRMTQR
jgi:Arc/MetJ-type ribon-helix-helix transcriptional regulator